MTYWRSSSMTSCICVRVTTGDRGLFSGARGGVGVSVPAQLVTIDWKTWSELTHKAFPDGQIGNYPDSTAGWGIKYSSRDRS